VPAYLADKSALARLETSGEVRGALYSPLVTGQVATCGVIDLEVLYSARGPRDHGRLASALRALPRVEITETIVERALDVQTQLAKRSQHRGIAPPDLIVAACAEHAGLTVMHYDADYERIAEVTGQPMQWVVPRGSVE
jgi:predicted nucleic acid-binding protein